MFVIEMLPAGPGDCLFIKYGDPDDLHYVLIDGGIEPTYAALSARLDQEFATKPVGERRVELFIVTHVDSDHIGGALKLLLLNPLQLTFGDIWFNAWRHLSPQQVDLQGGDEEPGIAPSTPADLPGPVQGEQFSAVMATRGLPWNVAFSCAAVAVSMTGDLPHICLPGRL